MNLTQNNLSAFQLTSRVFRLQEQDFKGYCSLKKKVFQFVSFVNY